MFIIWKSNILNHALEGGVFHKFEYERKWTTTSLSKICAFWRFFKQICRADQALSGGKSDMLDFHLGYNGLTKLPCCPLNNPRLEYLEPRYTFCGFVQEHLPVIVLSSLFSGRNTWQIFNTWPKRVVKREIECSLIKMFEAANHH